MKLLSNNKNHKHKKGMSLLEMLVALGIFAFMFMFIAQFLKQNHRQTKKIKKDIQFKSSLSHVISLIRQDFKGVAYFLDLNDNLNLYFPAQAKQPQSSPNTSFVNRPTKALQSKSLSVQFSPYFVFKGASDEIWFVSYSFSRSSNKSSVAQWIRIRYHIEECDDFNNKSGGLCLFRSTSRSWKPEEKLELEERLVLLRGFDSLKFNYASQNIPSPVWDEEWKHDFASQNRTSRFLGFFPSLVKMELKKQDRKQNFIFTVSQSYLKAWNPIAKAYEGFPQWTPPVSKKKKVNKYHHPPVNPKIGVTR